MEEPEKRSRGRPKGRNVTQMRSFRFTLNDTEDIRWLAAKWGKSQIAAIREAVRQACEREGFSDPRPPNQTAEEV